MSKYRIKLDGKTYEMEIERIDNGENLQPKAVAAVKPAAPQAPAVSTQIPSAVHVAAATPNASGNTITSPMPGTIVRINATVGDAVAKGQSVLVLEAMKMENDILSPGDGKITAMNVSQGDTVQGGSILFEIGE